MIQNCIQPLALQPQNAPPYLCRDERIILVQFAFDPNLGFSVKTLGTKVNLAFVPSLKPNLMQSRNKFI